MRPLYSICHTTARPEGWRGSYSTWIANALVPASVEYVLCIDPRWGFTHDDATKAESYGIHVVSNSGRKCMVDGFSAACHTATGKVLILNSDDQYPPSHWDSLLAELIGARDPETEDFVIHVLTGYYDGPQASSIQILSRARYLRLGYALHPGYESIHADDDFLEHAYADGAVIDGRHLPVFPHLHPPLQSDYDAVYHHQNNPVAATLGASLLSLRRRYHFGASLAGKLILFCPVRQDPKTLSLALHAHRHLDGVAVRWYYDDNRDPASSDLLRAEAKLEAPDGDLNFKTPTESHQWTPDSMARMARIRDYAIEAFLQTDASALLIVDSDLIPHPKTAEHLMGLGLPIVSEVFWTQWNERDPHLPNVWDFHNYGFENQQHILRLREPGVYHVGGLGAFTLLSRDALAAGARYAPVDGVAEYPGEDRHFCIRAAALGLGQWADTHYPPYHVYRPQAQFEAAAKWWNQGADPGWFREHWLDSEWEARVRTLGLAPGGANGSGSGSVPQCPHTGPQAAQNGSEAPRRVISICVPGERFCSSWVASLMALTADLAREGWTVQTQMGYSSNVYVTRAALWQAVRSQPATPDYVLWLDDDNLLDYSQFALLLNGLETHPEASGVCGWCWIQPDVYGIDARTSCGYREDGGECVPISPDRLAFALTQAENHPDRALVEIDYTGFPVFLLRGSTLTAMPTAPFVPLLGEGYMYGFSGEDIAFCERGRAAGLHWFLDPRVQVPHLKLRAAGPNMQAPPLAPLTGPNRVIGETALTIPEEAAATA